MELYFTELFHDQAVNNAYNKCKQAVGQSVL